MLRKPAAVIAAAWSAACMLAAAVRFAIVSTTISANASCTRGFLNRLDPIFFIHNLFGVGLSLVGSYKRVT